MKYPTDLLIALTLCLASCSSKESTNHTAESTSYTAKQASVAAPVSNPFVQKYAGGYMIEVRGISSDRDAEGYALRKDGTAKWMWIVNDGNGGANIQSEKTGTWTASDGQITVSINGNIGIIEETWQLKNDMFYDTNNPNRYLKTQD